VILTGVPTLRIAKQELCFGLRSRRLVQALLCQFGYVLAKIFVMVLPFHTSDGGYFEVTLPVYLRVNSQF
jgi:hypothetical protein